MGTQAVVCNRRSCQVIETPAQRLHDYLDPPVKVAKIDPKIRPKTLKKASLAVNNRKQRTRSKQNRIFWLRPAVKGAKGHPKGSPKALPRRFQALQIASKAPPRDVLEVDNLETLIF